MAGRRRRTDCHQKKTEERQPHGSHQKAGCGHLLDICCHPAPLNPFYRYSRIPQKERNEMNMRRTLILGLLLILVAGYFYIFEFRAAKQKEEIEESLRKIIPFSQEEITEINIIKKAYHLDRLFFKN